MRQRFLTFLAIAAAAFSLISPAMAIAGDDSAAVAVNTKDNSSVVKIVFDIAKLMNGEPVDATNVAYAQASCASCETVAIAIQIVLASGSPTVVVPENIAVAMNVDCSLCQTLADAYQFVYVSQTRMTFTKEGKGRIKEIQRQLRELQHSGLPIDQIQAQVEQLAAQIQEVLKTELVPVDEKNNGQRNGETGDDRSADPGTGTGTGTGTGSGTTPTDTTTTPSDTGTGTDTGTTPTDTTTTPSDTGTGTSTTPTDTTTTPTDTGTGTSTTPTDTGTGTSTTPTDTGTSTTPSG